VTPAGSRQIARPQVRTERDCVPLSGISRRISPLPERREMIRLLPLSWLLRLVRWTQPRSGAVLEAGAPSGREVVAQPPRGHACKLLALTAEAGVAQTACLPCRRLAVGSASARRLPTCDTAERHSALPSSPPAVVGGVVAVGMQAGVEMGNRIPRTDEGGFRKAFERVSEREAKMPTLRSK
jgi:hypothetical protein